jgi:four helix bundle protein
MINKKFRFRKFPVYKAALKFRNELKYFSKEKFPKEEQYCLTSQLWRALDSIVLNIAEGSDRSADKDFTNFLNKSHTSLNEVVACLDSAFEDGYISEDELNYYLMKAVDITDQLTAFRMDLLKNPTK